MPESSQSSVPPKILVTGATGRVGGTLVDLLAESDTRCRVIARRNDQLQSFHDRGIEAMRGDYDHPDSVRAALAGCHQLFLVSTGGANGFAQDQATIDAARAAGIRHVVKISGSDANSASSVPWAADYGRSDDYLRGSGTAFTILRPSCFMSNLEYLAPLIRRGALPGTSGHGATTWTDPDDLAAAAHAVLTEPARQGGAGDDGLDYLLTSTQPLSFPQVADILADTLRRRVRYIHIPGPVMYVGMRAGGSDHRSAHGMVMQFADVVRHGRDDVRVFSTDLQELIGRPGTRLETFIDKRHDVFSRSPRTC